MIDRRTKNAAICRDIEREITDYNMFKKKLCTESEVR